MDLVSCPDLFPIVWLIQPTADVPISNTAIQVKDGTMHVDSRWLAAPGPLERYGTDQLGRNVIPFVKESFGQVVCIALGAAFLCTLLGRFFSKVQLLHTLSLWGVFLVEIILFGWVFSISHYRTGVPRDHTLLLLVLLGIYFLPACPKDLSIRQMGLTLLDQMMRILLVITLMGLLGRTLGANPYETISAAYPVTLTYPAYTNLLATIWDVGLSGWWLWGMPLFLMLILILGIWLFKQPMEENYRRRGVYYTNLAQDFIRFFHPIRAVRELLEFKYYKTVSVARLIVAFIFVFTLLWARPMVIVTA